MVSHPFYNLSSIILLINNLLSSNKKILYITHNEECVKKFLLSKRVDVDSIVFLSTFLNIDRRNQFDLLIVDDVTGISSVDDYFIREYVEDIRISKKIIISMKKMFKDKVLYEMNEDLSLFKEPRSIQTKINLNEDMPHVVFEFLKWFMLNKTKVILITKDDKSCFNVSKYMRKYSLLFPKIKKIYMYNEFKSFNDFVNRINDGYYIYLTTSEYLLELYNFIVDNPMYNNFNIIVFFACSSKFNYKSLLTICGMCKFLTNRKNEIIFVSNYENIEIIMAKVISRSYNKKLWESGVRKY
ncbi:hypothetical protein SFBM_1268 [Candidatus Arthromitus sp. SFB-mouse-Japan]|nr:ComF operon protein A, DNA transporter ATPase [Candidatus Arthromitus sp. SFB-mouse-NL]EIA21698.1 hypothetical protein SFB3_439G5 [Candidatus Arthromitus sp. SFB-3]EIA21947.1 hypothetical protein SFB2_289G21 [Candidatus Arthromitus sp. SFB-2]EIA26977.1 hypothetical protein SFB6_131G3 [Candidatus Arthromitus sp. SFB-co]EIA28182.1 hypothetical protein SFB4_135G5 [Candidatus Arthromitus sp. SFB-4]EIA30045.1 hypothetical protein SFBSU_007G184 [Candidatus Arthromitus sp. SFB-mouse-SU]EIA31621.1